MSTDSSTNPSDVSGVSSGPRGEDGGQGNQNPPAQGRRARRGRRRRGRRKGEARTAAPAHSPASHKQPGHSQPGSGHKQPGHTTKHGHRQNGPNPAAEPAPTTHHPTPNDLARARAADPARADPVESESVEKLPVDPDRARPQVTPPKPSDMVAVSAKLTKKGLSQPGSKPGKNRRRSPRAERVNPDRAGADRATTEKLRTVRETSAGGLVISDLGLPIDELSAALIGRVDRRGRTMWSLPKGHIETGETAEQTAIREVEEETGIQGTVVAPLGKIDYWFVSEGRRIHKTVHHYLLRCTGGELSDEDYEVSEVAWVPLHELPRRLTYSDERRLARMARGVIADLAADPTRLAQSEAESIRTEPNAYEKAAAARNQRRNEPPPAARPRRRRRRPRRSASGDG
ncbi:NUDIX hydrolase [Gordonia sp. zg691]|uniref:NUDIX hydrolase n=1 Tax=Gordonia jinghuaiqii TaxID=2758710 RepID=A0A7D7LYA6_9ACTN|nr:NUDIX hydrolase [Gordonia jinghuaiqii]MBD0862824.1 NUDIX hydrolase [Gordonia jinghuaiqii]MCR5979043.1 NUDIX domain-containing protein [Gordonia jinghuaiqii]QMT01634.1 NUDIX hydrolase [Gordonia jinghuaiqii]